MFGKCAYIFGISTLVLAQIISVTYASEACDKIREEFRNKKDALNVACSDDAVLSQDCCRNVGTVLNETEKAELEKECPSCPLYSVYFPREDTRDYTSSRDTGYAYTAKISALTVCAWVKLDEAAGKQPYFVSYAATGGFSNEVQLFASGNEIYMMIRNTVTRPASFTRDGKWHAVCGTWSTRGGVYRIFIDGESSVYGNQIRSGKTLMRGGLWVVGNYQYSENYIRSGHTMRGEITMVNVWDSVQSDETIYQYSSRCNSDFEGDIKAWSAFRDGLNGNAERRDSSSCCNNSR